MNASKTFASEFSFVQAVLSAESSPPTAYHPVHFIGLHFQVFMPFVLDTGSTLWPRSPDNEVGESTALRIIVSFDTAMCTSCLFELSAA